MPVQKVVDPNDNLLGDITDAANVGAGNGFFKSQNGTILEFYSFDVDGIISASLVNNVWELSLGIVPPANGGLGVELNDPNADSIIFWDDSAGAHAYLTPGNSLSITGTVLDTIQDIRTTASPLFANLNLSPGGGLRTGQADGNVALLQAYDVDGATFVNFGTLRAGNTPTFSFHGNLDGNIFADGWEIQETGNILLGDTSCVTTLAAGGSQYYLSAYDLDGAIHVPFITFTSDNLPTCDLNDSVTKSGQYIYRAGGNDISLSDGGTGASLSDPNVDAFMFWDDSAGSVAFLTSGTNIISGTTLNLLGTTYTPTITNVTNVSSSVAAQCQYSRVGNTVTVSGMVQIDPTSASVATEIGISLPIASNFTLFTHCSGSAAAKGSVSLSGAILADTTNDRASLQFVNTTDTGNNFWHFHFSYTVL